MASTPEAKKAQAKKRATSKKAADAQQATAVAELAGFQADRDAAAARLINEPVKVKPDPHGDIDQRMAALEADHKRMGARP